MSATASDNVGVTKVEFYDGSTLLGTATASPFSQAWAISSSANGTHSLTAKAFDAANNSTTSAARAVTVNVAPLDTTRPVVSISSPANSTTYTSSQTVSAAANASDNVGVTMVEFYDGTTLFGTDTSSPFSQSWSITAAGNGSHSLTAKAFDAAGNTATSTAVTVTVNISSAATATLTWDANNETDLAGYGVYMRTSTGSYGAPLATVTPPSATPMYSVSNLSPGTYFFAVTAFDTSSNESVKSTEASKTVP